MCKLGKSASERQSDLQQVYSDTLLKKSAVYNWFSGFKNGQEMLRGNQRMTIAELEQEVGISYGSIHAILSDDLKMRRVSVKFVPRQLTMDQMACCMMVAGNLFDKSMQDPMFLKRSSLVMSHWCSPMTRRRRCSHRSGTQRHLPRQNSHLVRSKDKVMLIAFFDIDGLVHHEFVPPGQTVTGHFYVQVLQSLHDVVRRKWQGQWFLHHDNIPSHTLLVVQLTEKNIPIITQPPYSPDLAASDFWLFPTLKMGLKGTHFASTEDIKSNATAELQKIPKEANNDRINGASVCMQESYFEHD
ncbi:hypothetical protein B7P43_G15510 [Cryptotermes secundus]|uniref:Mos1 transposase HTH domain-containing protein n=1 Tax=Cryptotermes secundus TaxID=105785 RepID=A0A2J7QVM3_9NEOP|nr:hypothetical protein B7P43_G15510 [Cryptotermes secundus]